MYGTTMPETGRKVKENFTIAAAGPLPGDKLSDWKPASGFQLAVDDRQLRVVA